MKFNYDNYKNKILFKLPKISKHKKTINSLYIKNISREAQLSEDYHNWRFNILVNNKNELIKSIFKKNLFVSNHYYPISKLINKGSCPNSDMIFNHIINLFNDKRYNKNMALSTIDIINNHISRWGTPEF